MATTGPQAQCAIPAETDQLLLTAEWEHEADAVHVEVVAPDGTDYSATSFQDRWNDALSNSPLRVVHFEGTRFPVRDQLRDVDAAGRKRTRNGTAAMHAGRVER